MITTREHVNGVKEWNRSAPDPRGVIRANLDTTMDWVEHQNIVVEARKLVATPIALDEPGEDGKTAQKYFSWLHDAYNSPGVGAHKTLKVSKGIHQPHVNPHIQLQVTLDRKSVLFHLDVSAKDLPADARAPVTPNVQYFRWEPVQFSCVVGGNTFRWPAAAVTQVVKPRDPGVPGRTRRQSISSQSLEDHRLAAEARALPAPAPEPVIARAELDKIRLRALVAKHLANDHTTDDLVRRLRAGHISLPTGPKSGKWRFKDNALWHVPKGGGEKKLD